MIVHELLEGDVDRDLLGQFLVHAVRRHDAFRLRFDEDASGNPRVADSVIRTAADSRTATTGLKFTHEPDTLRFFRARFAPAPETFVG